MWASPHTIYKTKKLWSKVAQNIPHGRHFICASPLAATRGEISNLERDLAPPQDMPTYLPIPNKLIIKTIQPSSILSTVISQVVAFAVKRRLLKQRPLQ